MRIVMICLALCSGLPVAANEYRIDPTHTFVQWRVQHLGFSWLYGRFNEMSGEFYWDQQQPEKSRIDITIRVDSLDSNHAERDKHLRSDKYLDVKRHPTARFVSTRYQGDGTKGTLTGTLTLNGVSKAISFEVDKLGEGRDPWSGYRAGFFARTSIDRRDFGYQYDLGPMSDVIELELGVEGVQKTKRKRKR